MEKRLIAFVVISVVIIFTYPMFISWVSGPVPSTPSTQQVGQPSEAEDENAEDSQSSVQNQDNNDDLSHVPSETVERTDEANIPTNSSVTEIEKVIETDFYRVTLSNMGGTIKKWELKKYTEKDGESGLEVPIQLVPEEMDNFPLSLIFSETSASNKRIYQLDASPLQLDGGSPEGVVTLTYDGDDGKKIIKTLRFSHDSYQVGLKIETEGYNQAVDLSLGTNFGIHEWGQQRGGTIGAIGLIDNEVKRAAPDKMEEKTVDFDGKAKWFGLQDKYFISALIPEDDASVGPVSFQKEGEKEISAKMQLKNDGVSTHRFSLYVGPKEYDRLAALNVNLDESIDFGWFIFGSLLPVRMIAKPIFFLLRFFYQFTHNYGVSIIIITVLIKVLFYPITRKSMQSMKSMSTIQPKIAAIRKQWAKDKEKMNQELIKLYKTEKVNPMGGCLPMIVQIPVFISLFNILYTTIELRHAPFFLWVQDLSAKDPYYVLPIVMGATMLIQQYTAPKTMDSSQSKMMQFLPIVYTFFFLNFPSGLVLYWLVNNTLTIVQQQMLNKGSAA